MHHSSTHLKHAAFVVVAALVALACAAAFGQAPPAAAPPAEGAPAPAAAPPEAPKPPEAAKAPGEAGKPAADDGTIAVNLNNVDIDNVVKFLTEITGKLVIKHKDAKAQLSIFSSGKVSKERALSLISDALQLEKVALVEDKDTIKLVPLEMLSDVTVEMLPVDGEKVTGGIVKAVIPLSFADVEEIEKVVKPLLSKTGTLVAHAPSKKLIVTDIASRIAAVKDVVAQLDILDTAQRQVQVFQLQHADPEELAPILKSVLNVLAAKAGGQAGRPQPGQQPRPDQPPPQPGQPGQPQGGAAVLDVIAFKSAGWLVVVAPKEIVAAAVPLVAEFDKQKPKDVNFHVLPVKYADATQVAEDIGRLFQRRPDKRVKEIVEVSADSRSSSLIVLSSEDNFAVIQKLVAELDTEESVQTMTKSFELQYADADDVAEQMNNLYTGMEDNRFRGFYYFGGSRRDESKTRFVPERRTNSVVAIAKPTDMPKVEELIHKLDKPIEADQVAPRIYHLKYVDAQEVTEVLNDVFGTGDSAKQGGYYDYYSGMSTSEEKEIGRLYGKVRFVTETTTNSIIVTTNNKENFQVITTFIENLDRVSPDAANTMVIKLQHAKAEQLADQLNTLFAMEGARMPAQQQQQGQQQDEGGGYYSWLFGTANKKKDDKRSISNLIGQVRLVPDIRTNSLTVTTAMQNFILIKDLVEQLDVATPKVMVRVRLIEVVTTKATRIGTRISSDPTIFESDDLDNGLRSTFGVGWEDVYENGTIKANGALSIAVLVQFLRRNVDAKILSEPTLTMNNNETGTVFVGSRIPFITASQSTPEGTLNQSFEYKDAGTMMRITPNINELGKVEMKVELESSQIRPGEVLFGGFIIDSRQFNTQLAVNSGDTIVIGGIMRESEAKAIRKVPILGEVPIVNLAFKKKDTKMETTELIAFITPLVLHDPEEDAAATEQAAAKVINIKEWRPLTDEPEASKDPSKERAKPQAPPSMPDISPAPSSEMSPIAETPADSVEPPQKAGNKGRLRRHK